MRIRSLLALVLLGLLSTSLWADSKTYVVNDPAGQDSMTWEGRAHGETIHGKTNRVTALLSGNPADIEDNPKIDFFADLGSMTTGNGSRDNTMRSAGCSNTAQFPTVKWTLKKVTQASNRVLAVGSSSDLQAIGDLTLHGITHEVPVQATLTYLPAGSRAGMPGEILHVVGSLLINLTDFDIPPPQFLFFKMENTIHINLDVYGSTALKP